MAQSVVRKILTTGSDLVGSALHRSSTPAYFSPPGLRATIFPLLSTMTASQSEGSVCSSSTRCSVETGMTMLL